MWLLQYIKVGKKALWLHIEHMIIGGKVEISWDEFNVCAVEIQVVDVLGDIFLSTCVDVDVIILDGCTNEYEFRTFFNKASYWGGKNKKSIFAFSSTGIKTCEEDLICYGIETYSVPSWSTVDYESALSNGTFWSLINDRISICGEQSKAEWFENKYFYAGGSARFMFYYDLEPTMADGSSNLKCLLPKINNYLSQCSNFNDIFKIRLSSSLAVNHLYNLYIDDNETMCYFC